MGEPVLTARFRYSDVFGATERRFTGPDAYTIMHMISGEPALKPHLTEKMGIAFEHIPTGETKRFFVNFYGGDDEDFSEPVFLNEKAVDEWMQKLGIELEVSADG